MTNTWKLVYDLQGTRHSVTLNTDVVHLSKYLYLFLYYTYSIPIPLGMPSKLWICVPSLARVSGSNPAEGMDGCLFLVIAVCCQVEISASGRSLVQRSTIEWGVSECDREASTTRRLWPTRGCRATGGGGRVYWFLCHNSNEMWLNLFIKPYSLYSRCIQ
jgi:hypothetical protein